MLKNLKSKNCIYLINIVRHSIADCSHIFANIEKGQSNGAENKNTTILFSLQNSIIFIL